MFRLVLNNQCKTSLIKIKDQKIRESIWAKIQQLKQRAPIGKKLAGKSYWSIHINKYRVIYLLEGSIITVVDILSRKRQYRELQKDNFK